MHKTKSTTASIFHRRPLSLVLTLLIPVAANAQEAPARERSLVLEEVLVQARRVEESIQSVPVSITALDTSALREASISTSEELQMATPGVFLSGSGGRQNVVYQIRGQSKALSGTSSPAVVGYFAEVPDPVWGSSVPQFDMASIQVLKGPQGTLFGRNTTGGALLYSPQGPSYEFGGYIGGTIGNYDQRRIQGAVDLPIISEKAALRLAADVNRRDGYTKNLGPGDDLDNIDTENFRATLLLEPLVGLRNSTIVDYFKSDNNGFSAVLTDVYAGATLMSQLGLQQPAMAQLALQEARGPFTVDTSLDTFEKNERWSVINRTELELGNFDLINIFGYRTTDVSYNANVDGMPTLVADGSGAFPAGVPVNFIKADLYQQGEQYSNEFQIRSKAFDDKLDWLVGLFWLKSEPDGHQGNAVAFAHIPGTQPAGSAYNFITEESQAVFAHLEYDLGDWVNGLAVELGVRYTEDEIESCAGTGVTGQSNDAVLSDCTNDTGRLINTSQNEATSDATTWSVGLNWQATPDLFAYVVSRRGYRAGGINGPTLTGRLAQFQAFGPEEVTDIETGVRADWYVGQTQIRTNLSAFVGRYEEVQAVLTGVQTSGLCVPGADNPPGISPDGDCNAGNDPAGGTLLVNAGESQVSGADLEVVIAPNDAFSLSVGANYLDTETRDYTVPATLTPYVGTQEIPFNFTAQKTLAAGIRYEAPVDPAMAEQVVLNLDYYWTDELQKNEVTLPSYEVTNARVSINGVVGTGLDIAFFVRNLFDKEYVSSSIASGDFLGLQVSMFGPPRTYGMEARYNF